MKCSTAFCNRPAPMPSFEVPAPFCKWCTENPGSGRERVAVGSLTEGGLVSPGTTPALPTAPPSVSDPTRDGHAG